MPEKNAETDDTIASAVEQLLASRGALTPDQIVDALLENGVDLGPEPAATVDDLLDSDDIPMSMPLPDGRTALLTALLAGRTFTHRVTAAEIEHGLLDLSPDFEAVSILTDVEPFDRLSDGSPVVEVVNGIDHGQLAERGIPSDAFGEAAWILRPDSLTGLGLAPDDVVALRVGESGWELRPVEPTALAAAPSGLVEQLAHLVAAHAADGPAQLADLIWVVCADDADLFAQPSVPLADILDAAGVAVEGDLVAPGGFDFDDWRRASRVESLTADYDLSEDEALSVLAIDTLFATMRPLLGAAVAHLAAGRSADEPLTLVDEILLAIDQPATTAITRRGTWDVGSPAALRGSLDDLKEPAVAEATFATLLGPDRAGAAELGIFAELLEPLVVRSSRPAVRWLRARAYERMGRVLEAEAALEAAESMDPSWPLVLFDLARFASDRGDVERGLSLLRRAGAPADDQVVQLLERYRPTDRSDVARNAPCWCGSGRKYKQCHRGKEQLSLAERSRWLYVKTLMFLQDGPWRTDAIALAYLRSAHSTEQHAVLKALGDPLVSDVLLFEGGALQEFLDIRGVLLPEDEQLLAQQWLLVERSVYEVEDVERGVGFTTRDLRTGDRSTIAERLGSEQVSPGMLLCLRLLPTGGPDGIFGGVEPVGLQQVDALMEILDDEPTPEELVELLSARFAPPTLQNTEGEPLMECVARLTISDRAGLLDALDAAYEREDRQPDTGAEDVRWVEFVTTDGMERVRASLELSGETLRVETNSEARMDRVLATLLALRPNLVVEEDVRTSIADALAREPRGSGAMEPPGLDQNDPEVRAMLDEVVATFERNWLDQSIPALAGLTPREAALDPTRRPELIRLLATFPDDDRPGTMSPTRLRKALELD